MTKVGKCVSSVMMFLFAWIALENGVLREKTFQILSVNLVGMKMVWILWRAQAQKNQKYHNVSVNIVKESLKTEQKEILKNTKNMNIA